VTSQSGNTQGYFSGMLSQLQLFAARGFLSSFTALLLDFTNIMKGLQCREVNAMNAR